MPKSGWRNLVTATWTLCSFRCLFILFFSTIFVLNFQFFPVDCLNEAIKLEAHSARVASPEALSAGGDAALIPPRKPRYSLFRLRNATGEDQNAVAEPTCEDGGGGGNGNSQFNGWQMDGVIWDEKWSPKKWGNGVFFGLFLFPWEFPPLELNHFPALFSFHLLRPAVRRVHYQREDAVLLLQRPTPRRIAGPVGGARWQEGGGERNVFLKIIVVLHFHS